MRFINIGLGVIAFIVLIIATRKRKEFTSNPKLKTVWKIGLFFWVISWLLPLITSIIIPNFLHPDFWVLIPWQASLLLKAEAIFCMLICIKSTGEKTKPAFHIATAVVIFCVCAALTANYSYNMNVSVAQEKSSDDDIYYSSSSSGSSYSSSSSGSSGSSYSSSSSGSFTNKYGTATTKCAHPGCTNNIASSGDTNCCTVHSNKCLNCGKYIDEDAMYCMSCLSSSVGSKSSSGSSSGSSSYSGSSSSSSAGGPGKCKYKVGGNYVCSKTATNGSYCKEHYDYLNDAYNSLIGN